MLGAKACERSLAVRRKWVDVAQGGFRVGARPQHPRGGTTGCAQQDESFGGRHVHVRLSLGSNRLGIGDDPRWQRAGHPLTLRAASSSRQASAAPRPALRLRATPPSMTGLVYPLLAVVGIVLSAHLVERAQTVGARQRLSLVFLGGLFGMAVGAKLGFVLAEGLWTIPRDVPAWSWRAWWWALSGKTVLGGLLGAYAGVEIAKRAVGHREPTGDLFALTVPASLMLGRVGCLVEGCCRGVALPHDAWYALHDIDGAPRWPAPVVELLFNALMLALFYGSQRVGREVSGAPLRGQLFHLYLIAYGAFRFVHEGWRDTPRLHAGVTGYRVLALLVLGLGLVRLAQRARDNASINAAASRLR